MSCDFKISFYFGGQQVEPANVEEISVLATFEESDSEGVVRESQLSIDELRFIGEDARLIHNRALSGLNGGVGITEGEEMRVLFSDESNAITVFDGQVNFMTGYRFGKFIKGDRTQPSEVFVRIEKLRSVSRIDSIINGVTYGLLDSKGVFSASDWVDIPWIVQKKFDAIETLYISLTLFTLIKQGIDLATDTAEDAATTAGIAISGVPGPAGAALYLVLMLFIRAASLILIIIQIIVLMKKIRELIFPKLRYHKGATLRTLLSKAFGHFGFTFVSDIPELDTYVFLPTIPRQESNFVEDALKKYKVTNKGIPTVQDQGYLLSQMVAIVKSKFKARLAMVEGLDGEEIHLRPKSDDFWNRIGSVQVLEDVKIDQFEFNTDELFLDRFMTFEYDFSDDWTLDNPEGTNYEIITEQVTTKDPKKVNISGLDETRIPWALGNRKGSDSEFDKILLAIAKEVEIGLKDIGVNIDLLSKLKKRNNALKTSGPEISVAKILYMPDGNGIPEDHRSKLSAEYLMETYHTSESFVVVDPDTSKPTYNNQHIEFKGVTVPFNIEKFINMVENSYFVTDEGESGKAERIEWFITKDKAEVDGWLRFRYTENLKERKIL